MVTDSSKAGSVFFLLQVEVSGILVTIMVDREKR
jgi:hypothetical protein